MSSMRAPPRFIVLENVVGFEYSSAQTALTEILGELDYHFQEFLLSPLQYGTPYSRPRYFCVARKYPFAVKKSFEGPWRCTPGALTDAMASGVTHFELSPQDTIPVKNIGAFVEVVPPEQFVESFQPTGKLESNQCQSVFREDTSEDIWKLFRVPESVVAKSFRCIDIVTSDMHDTNCFTKSYSRYVKGTGSVLATENLPVLNTFADWGHREPRGRPWYSEDGVRYHYQDRLSCDEPKNISETVALMSRLKLRFFTPREVANLHAFPKEFDFPETVTLKQRYACLGNSLSVEVVASLLEFLIASPP